MNTQIATTEIRQARTRPSARSLAVLALGPLAVLAGVARAFLQPWRVTLLHPYGQGFWLLVVEPPLLVVLTGILFEVFIAPGIVRDLEAGEDRG